MALDTVNSYKLWDAATRRNPHPVYHAMREHDPVFRAIGPNTGNTFWFFTRYDDVQAVLKDPRFGRDVHRLPSPLAAQYAPPDEDPVFAAINRHMLNRDPPDHTRLRSLVHKAFTPRVIEALRARIADIAAGLLDAMAEAREVDLIDAFAFPLPVTVIAELLGIPAADQDKFRRWTKVLLFSPDEAENRVAAMEFGMYMNAMLDLRRDSPQNDLVSNLVTVEEQGDRLDRLELLSMIFLLLVAGHETTVNLIGNGMVALLTHPHERAKLAADPALIGSAVEEILRYNGPVEVPTIRFVMEDLTFRGHALPAGAMVMPSLLAANHDPAVFSDPDRFDIARTPNPHVAFGYGIHYCLGAPLARMEGAIAINALLARFPSLVLAADPDALEWTDNLLIHGVKALPVRC